jgi:signal transduction histidine kinase
VSDAVHGRRPVPVKESEMLPLRILIVDDELGMRLGVHRALDGYTAQLADVETEVRYSVEQAETGEEALEKLAAHPPDLLLLDHKLPGISGLDVIAAIAEQQLDLLVVMITAYASLETAVTATKRGAYDFLAKPFTPTELKGAVTKASKHLLLQRKARQLAEEKRQVRFQFLSVLAHELKSPLAAVEGYLYLMRDRAAGEELAAYDKIIQRTLARTEGMRKLIFDLLDLTRIESGQKKREIAEVDLFDAARAALDAVQLAATEQELTLELVGEPPLTLLADRGEIDIIFNNLISNAVKYNKRGGEVRVALSREGDLTKIEVRDTGIGMTPEAVARLFQEFVRIKTDQTRTIPGSGLGLSILKRLAHLYQGDATVRSELGVGSTFTVTLRPATE